WRKTANPDVGDVGLPGYSRLVSRIGAGDGRTPVAQASASPQTGENRIMSRVRMDKWLWAARFFKTRSLAARACELGRIESNGLPAKPAREVRVGDLLQVKNDSSEFQVEVLVLSDMR